MPIPGLHLTQIGGGDFLLEPTRSLNIPDQDALIARITARLIPAHAARLYYDLSSLTLIDPLYYAWLDKLARSVQAINVRMICINMQPTAAFALSKFIGKMPAFETALSI
jgi:rsbT antagonist protein RsbS